MTGENRTSHEHGSRRASTLGVEALLCSFANVDTVSREAQMYRSSVRKFVQGVLSLLDEGRDLTFDDVQRLQDYSLDRVLAMLRVDKAKEIRDGMPEEDWDEIMAYVGRFSTAHGPRALTFYDSTIEKSFMCWLAAIGVEMLSDL